MSGPRPQVSEIDVQGPPSAGIGGTVNMITKLPEAQPSAYLGAAAGSEGYWRLDADVNDTLLGDEGNRLMGRLIGSTSGAGNTEVGYVGASSDFVSAGLRWTNDASGSDLAAVYEYSENLMPNRAYVVSMGNSFHSGMKEYRFGPRNSYVQYEVDTVDVNFHQRIWESWSFNVNYIWSDAAQEIRQTNPFFVSGPDTVLAVNYRGPGMRSVSTANDLKVDVRGNFQTGPVAHQLMLAYDYNSTDDSFGPGQVTVNRWLTDLNTRERTLIASVDFARPENLNNYVENGVLAVDHVTWNAWSGLFGVRWASFENTSWVRVPDADRPKETGDHTLPQYGLVYEVAPDVRLYASGGDGYSSHDGMKTWQGEQIPDETSTQYEAGVKALVFERQLAVTLAVYRINQKNVAYLDWDHIDPDNWVEDFYITIPGLTTKGVELEVSGQPIRGLDVRANYTYTQQKDEDGEPPWFSYVPSSFNLWAQYWLSRETGQGWWGGFGLTAKSAPVQVKDSTQVPGFTTFDLQAGYASGRWNAIAGYKNVADIQTFYPTNQLIQFGVPQPGASFTFDLSYQF